MIEKEEIVISFVFLIFSFMWGASFGSFGNTLIYRIPRGISILAPSSFCPKCKSPILWYEKIPILSFIILRGKCSRCGARIPYIYFFSELLSAILGVFAFYISTSYISNSSLFLFFPNFFFLWSFLFSAISDIIYLAIPTVLILVSFISAVSARIIDMSDIKFWLLDSFLGVILGAGTFFIVRLIYGLLRKKEGLGEGDVLFMIPVGVYFGFWGTLFCIIISSFFGGLFGLILSIIKRKRDPIPFIPFMFLGVLLNLLLKLKYPDIFERFFQFHF
jgi:leader peptidase (prepilin peptidase)/N-methyltransferase